MKTWKTLIIVSTLVLTIGGTIATKFGMFGDTPGTVATKFGMFGVTPDTIAKFDAFGDDGQAINCGWAAI